MSLSLFAARKEATRSGLARDGGRASMHPRLAARREGTRRRLSRLYLGCISATSRAQSRRRATLAHRSCGRLEVRGGARGRREGGARSSADVGLALPGGPGLGHLSATSRPPLGHLSATSRPRAGRRVGQSCRILAVLGLISSGLVTFSHGPAAGARREAAGQARHEAVGADAARLDGVHGLARLGGVQAVTGEFARFGRVVGSPRWTFERPFAGAEGASPPQATLRCAEGAARGARRV